MKIFLDTADVKAIEKYEFLIDGVTTNPTHLSKVGGDPKQTIKKICSLMMGKDVSVEVTEKRPKAVYEQAKAIAALGNNVVVKIPCYKDYYPIIQKLMLEGVHINVTLIFTVIQALYMCKLGVKYVSPFVGRWDDIDVDGIKVLYEIRQMINEYGYDTELLAASLRHVRNVHDAILAGADIATMPVSVLEKTMEHVLTNQGIAKFDADWKKLGIKQFP